MPNTKSAKKSMKRDEKRCVVNHARKTRIKTFQKKFVEAVAAQDITAAKQAFVVAQSETMRGVTKGVLHKRTVARKIKRLNATLKKLAMSTSAE